MMPAEQAGKEEVATAAWGKAVNDVSNIPLVHANASPNAMKVLEKRYLGKDREGRIVEDVTGMWMRVARNLAEAERKYGHANPETMTRIFYNLMAGHKFLPNSPTIMNAGRELQMLSACFVLPVPDDVPGIFEAIKQQAVVHKGGGGTGFDFSRLRPKGDVVGSTGGVASGPISFMKIFNTATEQIKQGGCFVGSTLVATAEGPKAIKEVKPGDLVYAWDGTFVLAPVKDAWLTKQNAEVWRLETDKGLVVYATPDHPMMVRWGGPSANKEYVQLRDLKPGTPLMPLTRYQKHANGQPEWTVSMHDGEDTRVSEHVWMAAQLGIVGEHIHHKDGDHLNNVPANLVGLTEEEHQRIHALARMNLGTHPFQHLTEEQRARGVEGWKAWFNGLSPEERDAYWEKVRVGLSESNKARMLAGTHNFVTNHPWDNEATKFKAKQSRVATAVWKVMGKGLPVTQEAWPESVKAAGLYQNERFTVDHILALFDTWDNLLAYTNERNHRVVKVEFSHHEDVYDMEVPGPHNFVVCDDTRNGIVVSNTRRGANMAILRCDHPDVLDFIDMKMDLKEMTNFNVSVAITDEFMEAYKRDGDYALKNPKTGAVVKRLRARDVMDRIAKHAHVSGEPGIFFVDRANQTNPVPHIAEIAATNPCGEVDLLPFDSCNLGSIVLDNHLVQVNFGDCKEWAVDWDALRVTVWQSVRLLDNVVDMNKFPLPQIEEMSKGTRRIGLGIMGFARLLFKLGIPYDSEEGLDMARQIMRFIEVEGVKASEKLAEERGPYGFWEGSTHQREGLPQRRNSYVTTIAPTGTISMLAETSGGCEPEFSLIWYKNVMDGTHLPYTLDYFEEVARAEGFWYEGLMQDVLANHGSCRGLAKVPLKWQQVFATAMDVSPEWHVRMQAAFQEATHSAVSKTINLPKHATEANVKEAYLLAYETGCKGITVYRDGSRQDQVLNLGKSEKLEKKVNADETKLVAPASEKLGLSPEPTVRLVEDKNAHPTLVAQLRDDLNHAIQTADDEAVRRLHAEQRAARAEEQVRILTETLAAVPKRGERQRAPDEVESVRERIPTGYGDAYVSVGFRDNSAEPIEVIATVGKAGGYSQSNVEAACRAATLFLSAGGNVEDLLRQWTGIRSPREAMVPVRGDKPLRVRSVADGLALGVRRAIQRRQAQLARMRGGVAPVAAPNLVHEEAVVESVTTDDELEVGATVHAEPTGVDEETVNQSAHDLVARGDSPECPDCSLPLVLQEGCIKCTSCGYSEC